MHEVDEARRQECFMGKRQPCSSDYCMAWRWGKLIEVSEDNKNAKTVGEVIKRRPDLKDSLVWGRTAGKHFLLQGYCGLAGKDD